MTVIYGAPARVSLSDALTNQLKRSPTLRTRWVSLETMASTSAALRTGLHAALLDKQEDISLGKSRLAQLERHAGTRMAQPTAAVDAQKEEIARDIETAANISAQLQAATKVDNLDKAAMKAGAPYLARILADEQVRMVPVSLPKGDRAEAVEKVRAELADKLKTRNSIRNAHMPKDDYISLGVAKLKRKAAGAARWSHDPKDGPTMYSDFAALDDADVSRAVPNVEGLVIKLALDDLIEQLTAEVDRYYDTKVELALDATTKAERLRTLSTEILALERVEVELILALRASGSPIAFRPNTDPRALLGVDGPEVTREDKSLLEVSDF